MVTILSSVREDNAWFNLPDSFKTHYGYVKFLATIMQGETFVTPKKENINTQRDTERCKAFCRLHKLTDKSLEAELRMTKEDPDFAQICAPWFPVKCYYALYYLEATLLHLIDAENNVFTTTGHHKVRKKISNRLSRWVFASSDLKERFTLKEIECFPKIISGENFKKNFCLNIKCKTTLYKKLGEYELIRAEFRHKNDPKSKGLKTKEKNKKYKEDRQKHLDSSYMNLSDFFYYYRLKANYRDMDYIDFGNKVSAQYSAEYVGLFFVAYSIYRDALLVSIRSLE